MPKMSLEEKRTQPYNSAEGGNGGSASLRGGLAMGGEWWVGGGGVESLRHDAELLAWWTAGGGVAGGDVVLLVQAGEGGRSRLGFRTSTSGLLQRQLPHRIHRGSPARWRSSVLRPPSPVDGRDERHHSCRSALRAARRGAAGVLESPSVPQEEGHGPTPSSLDQRPGREAAKKKSPIPFNFITLSLPTIP